MRFSGLDCELQGCWCVTTMLAQQHVRRVIGHAGCGGIQQYVDVEIIRGIHVTGFAEKKTVK
jgi:hypothetical protein